MKPKDNIDALLEQLRDNPGVGSQEQQGRDMETVFKTLMDVKPTPAGELHWFCDKASPTTVAAASYLLRLLGYNGPSVVIWKKGLRECVNSCAYCAESLESIKVSARQTYFGSYQASILDSFFVALEIWELEVVLEDLKTAGFSVEDPAAQGRTLANIPPLLLYRMVINWTIFTDKTVQGLLHSMVPVPAQTIVGWPPKDPPPGMLMLLMDASQNVRDWAKMQSFSSDPTLMLTERFTTSYLKAFQAISVAIQHSTSNSPTAPTLPFSSDPVILWSSFSTALRLIPVEWLSESRRQPLEIRQLVIGHLSDTGPHFVHVLRCMLLLLKRLAKDLWTSEKTNNIELLPPVIFDYVKDNQAFLSLVQESQQAADRASLLAWIPELLHTSQETSTYGEVLAKTVDFLCEELQHERFKDSRPMIMNTGIQLLSSVFRKAEKDKQFQHATSLQTILAVHGGTVVAVAYDRRYTADIWKDVRTTARTFVDLILFSDTQRIAGTITRLCQSLLQVKTKTDVNPILPLTIRLSVWKAVHSSIPPKDISAIATTIRIVARISYLSSILKEPYAGIESAKVQGDPTARGDRVLDQVNDALTALQTGFLDLISKFADYSVSTNALDVISQPDVGKAVVTLLLSPVQDFQVAAQTIIGLAFDVDVRMDCFRAMFTNAPDATFDGLIDYLTKFNLYAAQVPEACAPAKSLVRCFNDVLEVLCSSPDGLLLKVNFLRPRDSSGPASRLLELWKLLTTSITIIFKRTVTWSAYYKPKEMVEWMRDAIILGRDIIKQWRVFETATNGNVVKPSKKLSPVGDKIVSQFQDMLPELAKWLRLTDEELLYQAFAILQSLLEVFEETDKRPHEATLTKLTKYISDAKADKTKSKSRLDAGSLMKLEDALVPFITSDSSDSSSSSDDGILIVSHTKPSSSKPKKLVVGTLGLEPKKPARRPHIQQQLQLNKQLGGSKPGKSLLDPRQRKLDYTSLKGDNIKIEAASKLPAFRKASQPVASTSKIAPVPQPSKAKPAISAKSSSTAASSESESSSEDDENPEATLAALTGQFPKSPKIKKQERRSIKKFEIATAKNPMQERLRKAQDERREKERLRPDITSLHKVILSWSYSHDGPHPPSFNSKELLRVPGEFSNYDQFLKIFRPLLLLECWAQICRTKEEVPPSFLANISAKTYVSDWIDLDVAVTDPLPKDWGLTEVDIVLLATPDGQKSVMAKTIQWRKNAMTAVASIRCFSENADPALQIGSPWKISKIFSLSTINREYGALMALPYFSCFNSVMHPKIAPKSTINPSDVSKAMLTYGLNKPQANAILGAMASEGFVLIQGPPGTGKTSTICALVARFMAHRASPIRVPGKEKEEPPKPKILICAPSNAAIDEIASRLKSKYPASGERKLNLVRMGAEGAIGATVKDVSLDSLVRKKIEVKTGFQGAPLEDLHRQIQALVMEMDSLKHLREEKLKELEILPDPGRRSMLEQDAQALRMKRQTCGAKLNELRDQVKSDNRSLDTLRRQMRREVIQEADVICSTLSGAGHEALIEQQFEMVIIDEAAQAIELSSLIPLKYNSTRCIMVGDPQQLPPTVISQEATRRGYDQSLFLRLFNKCRSSVHLLSIQYRMHPEISRFPSKAFYDGHIEDGPGMEAKTTREWHADPSLGVFKFFNVNGNEEAGSFNSLKNKDEVQAAKALYLRLSKEITTGGLAGRIGIVSMYRAQVQELRRQFFQAFGQTVADNIDFNTVDGFQGQEKDIIILSCVRAGPGVQRIGFLADVRRLNVAITRAKSSLFILGNVATLERSDETWKSVVADARERSLIVNVDSKTFTQPKGIASVAASTTEPPKKKARLTAPAAQPSQSIPDDLVTPTALINSTKKPQTNNTVPDIPPKLQTIASGSKPNLKRTADEDAAQSTSSGSNPPKPQVARPPPPKRQKPDPMSTMFIKRKPPKK